MLSSEQQGELKRCTKGPVQSQFIQDCLRGWEPVRFDSSAVLAGRALSYQMGYRQSFNNLLVRVKRAGFVITVIPGPRGGMSAARYRIDSKREPWLGEVVPLR